MKEKLKIYANLDNHADIETMGLWDDVNSLDDIHCVCSIVEDPETKEEVTLLFHNHPEWDGVKVWDEVDQKEHIIPKRSGTLIQGLRYWYLIGQSESGKLYVHNCMTYDKPIIEKVLPKCQIPFEKWVDTLTLSKVNWFDRPMVKGAQGQHGLKSYGIRFGVRKPDITDWKVMTPYILSRVIEDCKIQRQTSIYLEKEHKLLNSMGINLTDAYKMENEYATICHKQQVTGVKVDIPHIKHCLEVWDKRLLELEDIIQPLLPPTVKPNGAKIGKKALATLMGYPEKTINNIKETFQQVKRNGEIITDIIKPYYKPSVNFHITKKVNQYTGFNISYGESPTFIKKTDLTKWIKNNHPDTKPKEWDIEKSIIETKLLNKNTCEYFNVEPEDINIIVGMHTRVKFLESKMTQHDVVKAFLIKSGIKHVKEWNLKKDDNGVVKAEFDHTIHYPPKASYENQLHIDIKKGEPLLTSPKLCEEDYSQLTDDKGLLVAEFNTMSHRRRYFENQKDPLNKGLLSFVRDDGRVPANVRNFGTATGRGAGAVIVNLPSDSAPFGKEMRSCLIADKGKEFVGCDQKSSQLSIASFVTNNVDYYNAVATGVEFKNEEDGSETFVGTSAHCVNSRYFNLVTEDEWKEAVKTQDTELVHSIVLRRKSGKALSFMSLFGCSYKKLAVSGGFTEEEAKIKLQSFLDGMGLTEVISFLEKCKDKYPRGRGFYIPTAFGYWIYCTSMHKAVNYQIQSMEASVQKRALILMDNKIKELNWEGKVAQVLDQHDEILLEVDKGMGVEVGEVMCSCYTQAGIDLNNWYKEHLDLYPAIGSPKITCDFSGGYAIGQNYYECH